MRIYHASDCTDTVAFHSQLINQIPKHDCHSLSLLTKNAANILNGTVNLSEFNVFIQLTITGLGGTVFEPNVPPYAVALQQLRDLVKRFGRRRVGVRFDPIIPGHNDDVERYMRDFTAVGVHGITVSVIDAYKHVRERFARAGIAWPWAEGKHAPDEIRRPILDRAIAFAEEAGVTLRICCEPGYEQYQDYGCDFISDLVALRPDGLPIKLQKGKQRKHCSCPKMVQVGLYCHPCGHRCLYCYVRRGGSTQEKCKAQS